MREPRAIVPDQLPPPPSAGAERWSWSVAEATELSRARRDLRNWATGADPASMVPVGGPVVGGPVVGGPVMAAGVERLLLVFSELTTNGLRHAIPPVDVVVSRTEDAWHVVVSDGQVDAVPARHAPDPRRPGQHGLIVVEAVSAASGWFRQGGCKHVWAIVPDAPPGSLIAALAPPA